MSLSRGWSGPVKAEPDFSQLLAVLRRQKPGRPTLFEFYMNEPLYRTLVGSGAALGSDPVLDEGSLLRIAAFRAAGYDYVTLGGPGWRFPTNAVAHQQTVSLNAGAIITDRASFERYAWPVIQESDYERYFMALAARLPRGMKAVICGPCGVLENLVSLVGFDTLCYLLADDPDLVQEIADAIGSRLLRHYELAVQFDAVGAIIGNDDWGFKTQPMIAPADMRRFVIPWHRRIVAAAHQAGKPAILHSCGCLTSVMNDIIDDIRYDGKHSFEDIIQPVEEAFEQYQGRIALMGGMDMDFMVRSTPDAVYHRSRAMLERAEGRGGFALGTGNSVPEYVPPENYFAMLAAALEGR